MLVYYFSTSRHLKNSGWAQTLSSQPVCRKHDSQQVVFSLPFKEATASCFNTKQILRETTAQKCKENSRWVLEGKIMTSVTSAGGASVHSFCLCHCTLCRFFSFGGRLSRIIFMALSGGSLKYGGSPSTISMTMIPRDQISTWTERDETTSQSTSGRNVLVYI